MAANAGTSLESIAEGVVKITEMSSQIAIAAREQTSVTEEIDRNIITISEISDSTAEGAQQTALRSETLNQISTQLTELVSRFKVAA